VHTPVCILADGYPQPLARVVDKPSDASPSTALEEDGSQVQQFPASAAQQRKGQHAAHISMQLELQPAPQSLGNMAAKYNSSLQNKEAKADVSPQPRRHAIHV
jgi:hypothetical protein